MTQIFETNVKPAATIDVTSRVIGLTIAIGAALGLLVVGLTFILDRFIILPVFCQEPNVASFCAESGSIAGGIATAFVAIVGVFLLVGVGTYRPIIIAVASAVSLWGITSWLGGTWYIALVAAVLFYALAYFTFSWIVRLRQFVLALGLSVAVVAMVRVVIALS